MSYVYFLLEISSDFDITCLASALYLSFSGFSGGGGCATTVSAWPLLPRRRCCSSSDSSSATFSSKGLKKTLLFVFSRRKNIIYVSTIYKESIYIYIYIYMLSMKVAPWCSGCIPARKVEPRFDSLRWWIRSTIFI